MKLENVDVERDWQGEGESAFPTEATEASRASSLRYRNNDMSHATERSFSSDNCFKAENLCAPSIKRHHNKNQCAARIWKIEMISKSDTTHILLFSHRSLVSVDESSSPKHSTIKHIHTAADDYSLLQSLSCQGFSRFRFAAGAKWFRNSHSFRSCGIVRVTRNFVSRFFLYSSWLLLTQCISASLEYGWVEDDDDNNDCKTSGQTIRWIEHNAMKNRQKKIQFHLCYATSLQQIIFILDCGSASRPNITHNNQIKCQQ